MHREGQTSKVVPDATQQDKGKDCQGCDAAGVGAKNEDVQLFGVQR